MTPQSIALNRFGLGYRQGDELPRDPKSWLKGQIRSWRPLPGELGELDLSSEGVASLVEEAGATRAEKLRLKQLETEDAEDRFTKFAQKENQDLKTQYAVDVGLRLRTAVDTAEPFMERMVQFWSNHFTVSMAGGRLLFIVGTHEFGGIRPHVAGRFTDLLKSAVLHPAMLTYLNQTSSSGPNSPALKMKRTHGLKGLNENLGREILELHTLGVNGGYTQADVIELSKALTGWVGGRGARRLNPRLMANGASFVEAMHEPGVRTILGRKYPQQGAAQVKAILDDLALHPATARHVATKLARHFTGDTPPPAVVDRLTKTFLDTKGDLPRVYEAIIDSPEAWVDKPLKVRQPYEWMVAILRAAGKQVVTDWRLAGIARRLGQPTWGPPSPAGWDDIAPSWLGPDALLRRIRVADALSQKTRLSDVRALARLMYPGSLSDTTEGVLAAAESNQMALALLAVSPEMMRR